MIEALEDSVVYLLPYDKLMLLTENIVGNQYVTIARYSKYSLIVSQIKADSWRSRQHAERYSQLMEAAAGSHQARPSVAHRLLSVDDSRNLKPGTFGHTLIFYGNARTGHNI